MFGGISNKLSILRKKSTATDVVPDALNWDNPTGSIMPLSTISQTITGINTTITIKVSIIKTDDVFNFSYVKNGGSDITISDGMTFTVVNNDTLVFKGDTASPFGNVQDSLQILNNSNGDTVLDTIVFTYDTAAPPPLP